MGTGHFMRCLALADELKRRGALTRFLCRNILPSLERLVTSRAHGLQRITPGTEGATAAGLPGQLEWLSTSQEVDAQDTLAALGGAHQDWLVVDHYGMDATWERLVRPGVSRILVIDDLADRAHDCDVLLDQNLYADAALRYVERVPAVCQMLLGPDYALLRPEFANRRADVRMRDGPVGRIMIFMGGADAGNITGPLVSGLRSWLPAPIGVDVVIGAGHPAEPAIASDCASHGYALHVQTTDMDGLIARADMAIGAGGSATWERCCLGLPTLTIAIAENQRLLVHDASRAGLICGLETESLSVDGLSVHARAMLENDGLRNLLSRNGMEAVDGLGAERVAQVMDSATCVMRPARQADASALHAWRNAPGVREASRNRDPIPRDAHDRWFNETLGDPNRMLLIGERDDGTPLGVVRFDIASSVAEVSIYTIADCKTKGRGRALLCAAEQALRQRRPDVETIVAEVLGENEPSHRLFKRAGYCRQSTQYFKDINRK
jgi:UDP-2,4-diacetamido-2,4,6-trideoxy-beta-L-altropyranose hydrolase